MEYINVDCTLLFIFLSILNFCCPEWIQHGNYEYIFSNITMSWNNSLADCHRHNSSLASIVDRAESEFIIEQATRFNRPFWIGLETPSRCNRPYNCLSMNINNSICSHTPLNNPSDEYNCCYCRNKWRWTDGSRMDFMKWQHDEPTGGQYCGRIKMAENRNPVREGWFWYDTRCNYNDSYICKRIIGSGETTTSSGGPGETTTSAVQPGETTTSGGGPGETTTSAGNPGETTTSAGDPGETTTSAGQPGETTTSAGQPGETTTSAGQPGENTTSVGQPGETTTSAGNPDPNKKKSNANGFEFNDEFLILAGLGLIALIIIVVTIVTIIVSVRRRIRNEKNRSSNSHNYDTTIAPAEEDDYAEISHTRPAYINPDKNADQNKEHSEISQTGQAYVNVDKNPGQNKECSQISHTRPEYVIGHEDADQNNEHSKIQANRMANVNVDKNTDQNIGQSVNNLYTRSIQLSQDPVEYVDAMSKPRI